MVATKNRMQITVLDGPETGKKLELFYRRGEKSWNAIRPDGEIIRLSSMEEGFYMVYLPNGETLRIDPAMPREEGLSLMKEYKSCYRMKGMLAEAR